MYCRYNLLQSVLAVDPEDSVNFPVAHGVQFIWLILGE